MNCPKCGGKLLQHSYFLLCNECGETIKKESE